MVILLTAKVPNDTYFRDISTMSESKLCNYQIKQQFSEHKVEFGSGLCLCEAQSSTAGSCFPKHAALSTVHDKYKELIQLIGP